MNSDNCPRCGQSNPVSNNHCDFCGEKLPWAQVPIVAQTEPANARQHFLAKGDNRLLSVALGCCAGATAFALPYMSSALVETVKGNHLKAVDSMATASGVAVFGCFWGFTVAYFFGRLVATVMLPPIFLLISMYFLMRYPH